MLTFFIFILSFYFILITLYFSFALLVNVVQLAKTDSEQVQQKESQRDKNTTKDDIAIGYQLEKRLPMPSSGAGGGKNMLRTPLL